MNYLLRFHDDGGYPVHFTVWTDQSLQLECMAKLIQQETGFLYTGAYVILGA